jgi:hypothetical protein
MPQPAAAPFQPLIPPRLRRLDVDRLPPAAMHPALSQTAVPVRQELYTRRPGSLESRLLGRMIHALLESYVRARAAAGPQEARAALWRLGPQFSANLRSQGCTQDAASAILKQAFSAIAPALESALGDWLFEPHPAAASEVKWTALAGNELRQLRPDRLFLAGPSPLAPLPDSPAARVWWIIDYKSAHLAPNYSPDELEALRGFYAPQVELYGKYLRQMEGSEAKVNLGLFYPSAAFLDYWSMPA